MKVEVTLLDGNPSVFEVDAKMTGEDLLTQVAESLTLHEKDYFGFLCQDKRDKIWTWLHADRKLTKQLKDEDRVMFQV